MKLILQHGIEKERRTEERERGEGGGVRGGINLYENGKKIRHDSTRGGNDHRLRNDGSCRLELKLRTKIDRFLYRAARSIRQRALLGDCRINRKRRPGVFRVKAESKSFVEAAGHGHGFHVDEMPRALRLYLETRV